MKELYGGFVTVVLLENGTISSDIGDVYTLNFSFPLISVRKHHDWNDTINCQPRLGLYMYAEGKIMVEMEPATIDDSLCLCVAPFAFGEKSEWQIAYLMHNEVALYGKVQNNTYYLCLSN
ncbi:MAG: hypothetical protein KKD31_05885 [Bacteroidetes bacterium]|nr:hypothetical protein [Bacteroidota bacterium]